MLNLPPNSNSEREQRINQAFEMIDRAARRSSKTFLGRGFELAIMHTCHNKWPAISVKIKDLQNPTADTPFILFRADDSFGDAALEVSSKTSQHRISLVEDNVFHRLPHLVESWFDEFIQNSQLAVGDLHFKNTEAMQQRYTDEVIAIEVKGGLELNEAESDVVKKILGGIYGAGNDEVVPIVIDTSLGLKTGSPGNKSEKSDTGGASTRIIAANKYTVVAERYRLEKLLGTGGMGAVFEAFDVRLSRKIAIKVLHPTLADDQNVLHRFFREVQLIRRVKHPNVITVFDSGAYQKVIYYTMEFIDGLPLQQILNGRRLKTDVLVNFALQLTLGLQAIHKSGVVHRDLKAENVVITTKRLVKIIDFGIARSEDQNLTQAGEVIGSPAYLAPELWQGRSPSGASDLYAMGIIFYRMITGSLPFTGDNPISIMNKHCNELPSIPKDTAEKVPLWFIELVLALLQKKPEERPTIEQTMATLQAKRGLETNN